MKVELNNRVRKNIFTYLAMVILGILFASSCYLFIMPNEFAPSGITGICAMIEYSLNFSFGYMALIINIPLCIFAYFFIEKDFAYKTFVFNMTYSLFYILLKETRVCEFLRYIGTGPDTQIVRVIAPLVSGAIDGFVSGMAFRMNACPGGTDIVSKFISVKKPFLNFFWVNFVINSCVAVASAFVYSDGGTIAYTPVFLCMLYCLILAAVGNVLLKRTKTAFKFTVITTHANEISEEILQKTNHTSTVLTGEGMYTHVNKQVLICVISKHQLVTFENIIKKYDNTFSVFETANGIYGMFNK